MKKLIALALAAVVMSNARAQLSIAPVAGPNVSGYSISSSLLGYSEKRELKLGICAGALMDIPLKGKFSLQTGLLYKMNGYRSKPNIIWITEPYDLSIDATLHTIDLPIKLTYVVSSHNGNKFFIGAGPFLAITMWGSIRATGNELDAHGNPTGRRYDQTEKFGPSEIDLPDLGAGINAGYQAAKGLLICVQGQYGLWNLAGSFGSIHSYNFGVVAGYSLKLKKKKTGPKEAAR